MTDQKTATYRDEALAILSGLGVSMTSAEGQGFPVHSPLTGETLATLSEAGDDAMRLSIGDAVTAQKAWRSVPAPRRGELIRLLGEELRGAKAALGRLVSIEVGKSASEGAGEVQEMIDICDFAVGLSRQLYGLTIATERPDHRMMETWHPMGVVGIITAFNFPVAVWSWNAALALVCGNTVVWKPSEKAPLTALAVQAIFRRAAARFGSEAPEKLAQLVIGGAAAGQALVDDPRVPVLSATGSTRMGRLVGEKLARRFARPILELGGNNAAILAPSADPALALRAIAFAAMGTAGQRCTTLRRLFVHDSLYADFLPRLQKAFASVAVGDPLQTGALVGPLIDRTAFDNMQSALDRARAEQARVHGGERVQTGDARAHYVRPALVEMPKQTGPMLEETFAPILYVTRYHSLEQAIDLQNAVAAGLSSSIFTRDLAEAERFMSAEGSDCGIANVNIGPSGAEIGGAFGGEKETGGGREAGSDSWKAYMRRTTNTINFGTTLPLAQGVTFDVEG